MQKVKERGSCPMRDNKNRPHRPLWRSCSPIPNPRAPPSTLDHFHTPDAIAMMTVDHKIAHKVESGHVEVTVAIFSCVTTRMPPPTAGRRAHTHAGIHIKHTCLATLLLPLPRRYPAKSLANISIKENVRTV